jgi:hypothetical protein
MRAAPDAVAFDGDKSESLGRESAFGQLFPIRTVTPTVQSARERETNHGDGAGQHADRDQSAFAVAHRNEIPAAG